MESNIVQISARQYLLIVLMFVTGSSILLVPPGLIFAAKQDAWISAAVGLMMGLALSLLYIKLGKMYPQKTLFEFVEVIFGKWMGRAVSILYILFAFILASQVLSNVGDFISTQIMVSTPKKYINLLFLLPVIYAVGLGLETISRSIEAMFPTLFIMFFGLLFLLLPEIEPIHLMPIFGEGIKPILKGSLTLLNLPFLELVLLLVIFPRVNSIQKAAKAFWLGGLIGGLLLVLIPMMIIMILGNAFPGLLLYPSYALAKMVDIGEFLQRIEVVYAAIWISTLFYKLVLCFYVSLIGINYLLGIKDGKILLYPFTLILWILSIIIYPNYAFYQTVIQSILSYKIFFGLFLPLLMLTVSMIKSKMKKSQEQQQQMGS